MTAFNLWPLISEPSQHWRYEQDTYKDLIKLLQPQLQTSTSKTTPSFCMNLVNSPALLALFTSFAAWNVRQLLLQRAQSCRFREAADYRQRRRTYHLLPVETPGSCERKSTTYCRTTSPYSWQHSACASGDTHRAQASTKENSEGQNKRKVAMLKVQVQWLSFM